MRVHLICGLAGQAKAPVCPNRYLRPPFLKLLRLLSFIFAALARGVRKETKPRLGTVLPELSEHHSKGSRRPPSRFSPSETAAIAVLYIVFQHLSSAY